MSGNDDRQVPSDAVVEGLLRTDFGRAVDVPDVLARVRMRIRQAQATPWWPVAAAALLMLTVAGGAGFRLGAGLSAIAHGVDEAVAEPWDDGSAALRAAGRIAVLGGAP